MRYCAIFMKYYAIIQRYCAIIRSRDTRIKYDGPKGHVPQNEISIQKCNPKSTIFHDQTLIKFNFQQNLYPNRVIIPQFRPNLPKFLEISKFGTLFDYSKKFLVLRVRYDVPSLRFTDHKQLQNDFLAIITS